MTTADAPISQMVFSHISVTVWGGDDARSVPVRCTRTTTASSGDGY